MKLLEVMLGHERPIRHAGGVACQYEWEYAEGILEGNPEGVVVYDLHLGLLPSDSAKRCTDPAQVLDIGIIVPPKVHILRRERLPIGPFHALAHVDGVALAILRGLPALYGMGD